MKAQKTPKTTFFCSECGATSAKWTGQCSACEAWNTLQEAPAAYSNANSSLASRRQGYAGQGSGGVEKLSADRARAAPKRVLSTFSEFDRVLGGGFVAGEVVLLGGDPGIGKSTLLIQVLCALSQKEQLNGGFYVSGEESLDQIALRAQRLGLNGDNLDALCETEVETIIDTLDQYRPPIAVIDSIQTLHSSQLAGAAGSVAQVRECAAALTRFAKATGTIIVLVGHVTKDGSLAGPRALEHIVDAVLYFEGEPEGAHRIIRSFKNRFGAAQEVGVFAMGEMGLKEVPNPSALFLVPHKTPVNGACVFASGEGTRPLLIEMQALVEETSNPNARRLAVGADNNRLALILAIFQKHTGISCADQNVYLNATGGVRITETGWDLPAVLAITSSIRNVPTPLSVVAFGELGLTGEIRPTAKATERLNEAAKMGFRRALVPELSLPTKPPQGMDIRGAASLMDALGIIHEWQSEDEAAATPPATPSSGAAQAPKGRFKGRRSSKNTQSPDTDSSDA